VKYVTCTLRAIRDSVPSNLNVLGVAMKSRRRLLAAVTASGAVLCLSVSADGSVYRDAAESTNPFPEQLSLRVERLREKLRATSPGGHDVTSGKIDNIVQFFNFNNCMRGRC
jgi:hypothetical protein